MGRYRDPETPQKAARVVSDDYGGLNRKGAAMTTIMAVAWRPRKEVPHLGRIAINLSAAFLAAKPMLPEIRRRGVAPALPLV